MRETHFADEVTRHSYQLALEEMDARIGDAGLTATVTLQTNGEVTMDARESGPESVHKVRDAAKRAAARTGMATDWLRQLARITQGVKRESTIYSGASLTLTTGPGKNTTAGAAQDSKKNDPRNKAASRTSRT